VRRGAAAAAGAVVAVAAVACGGGGGTSAKAVAACSLLTAAEVSAAAGSTFGAGRPLSSDSDLSTAGCYYTSPKGYTEVWVTPGGAAAALNAPACGTLEHADGKGYRGSVCTTRTDVQIMYLASSSSSLVVEVGAAAPAGAARSLGALAAGRLP
jgi:hypothetical protein